MGKLDIFAEYTAGLCSRCLVEPGEAGAEGIRYTVIANPRAGGFTIRSNWKKHESALKAALEKAAGSPVREDVRMSAYAGARGSSGLVLTEAPGHAGKITSALTEEASKTRALYLVITAGGDGTSLEVLETLYAAPPDIRSRFAVLRLPLGTGNDGADSRDLGRALDALVRPSAPEPTRGIRLSTSSGKTWPDGRPFLAFNILSVGLDAFVTHMTNKMKGRLPGDSYKLWVDIAALFYDLVYKVGPLAIQAYDEQGIEMLTIREPFLLCAMGISGGRSYGSGKKILPDERNVCAVKQMPLLRKLALKDLFSTGRHIEHPHLVLLWNADKIVISGEYPILAQMDGETTALRKEDFPLTIALTEPVLYRLAVK